MSGPPLRRRPATSARDRGRAAAALLALAAAGYVVAAWSVAPGFYDGIGPAAPYRWVSPPPELKAGNQPPLPGHGSVKVASNGLVDPGSIFTQDGQAAISFVPGAFLAPPDRSPVTLDIQPVAQYPDLGTLKLATNVYCFTSSSPLAQGKDVLVTLTFSNQLPAPGDVYTYQGSGPWRRIGSTGAAQPFSIAARSTGLGCFAGAYPGNAAQTASGLRLSGGQTLPILVALAILVVVLAGVPLAVLRRRGGDD